MCIACHYTGSGKLVPREARAAAHGDGDYRCVRVRRGQREHCVDCRERLDPDAGDFSVLRGRVVTNHMCLRVFESQVFGTRQPRYRTQESE